MIESIPTGAAIAGVAEWGRRNRRDLPWRRVRERWPVLMAEVMLQQTGVGRGVQRWQDAIVRWPSPASFAVTPMADVLRWWSGLGYPRRARDLHRAAELIVSRWDGEVPGEIPDLLALPGVGPYTARAVLAFADDRSVGVVDTNTGRVFARVVGRRLRPKEVQKVADDVAVAAAKVGVGGWEWNQTLLDVGALVCRPTPACEVCPAACGCAWFGAGVDQPDPAAMSAGVSRRQAPFAGSDRAIRGRIMASLAERPRRIANLVADTAIDPAPDRIGRLVAALVAEGLCEWVAPGSVALFGDRPGSDVPETPLTVVAISGRGSRSPGD